MELTHWFLFFLLAFFDSKYGGSSFVKLPKLSSDESIGLSTEYSH